MKAVEIVYGTDVFSNQLSADADKRLKTCKVHKETSFASDSLSIDYITYEVVSDTDLKSYFDYSTPQYLYDDGELKGVFYAPEVTKESKRFYKVTAYSDIKLLQDTVHVGGLYAGQTAGDVIAELMGDIPYTIDEAVARNTLYGWLPYSNSRDNLSQVLFVLGAGVYRDESYNIYIRYAVTGTATSILAPNIYTGGTEETSQTSALALVYSHKYVKGGESVTLVDETSSGEQLVLFDEPIYNLSITNGTIVESGVNYAIINALGAVVLTGNKYVHSTEIVQRGSSDATDDNTSVVKDATLVSYLNAQNVAKRVYRAGLYGDLLHYAIHNISMVPGDSYSVQTIGSGILPCVVSAVDENYSAVNKADCDFTIGAPLASTDSSDISLSINNVTVTYKQTTIEVIVTALGDWAADTSATWLTLSSESGTSGTIVYITAAYNFSESSRYDTVTFSYGESTATLIITQEGLAYEISTSPSSLSFTAEGAEATLTITSTTDWALSNTPSWATVSATSGVDGDTVTVTAPENTSTSGRSDSLIFVCGEASVTVPIVQKGSEVTDSISLSSESGNFIYSGGTATTIVSSTSDWEAVASSDWIALSATSGVSGDTVTITVEGHTNKVERSGYVTFTCGGAIALYTITQEAFVDSITLSKTSINFDEYGSTETLTVTSSDTWTAEVVGDWFAASPLSGSSGTTVTITAPANFVESKLTGTIVFTCGTATATLALSQDADTTSSSGNTYSTRQVITSDGTFTVPTQTKRLRIVLIGGGNGGNNGEAGGSTSKSSESTYANSATITSGTNYGALGNVVAASYTTAQAAKSKTLGGSGGSGGTAGKVLQVDLTVSPGDSFSVKIGQGGASNTAGTNSEFGEYSSSKGESPSSGYEDPITGEIYCVNGADGEDGGDGGSPGSSGDSTNSASGGAGKSTSSVYWQPYSYSCNADGTYNISSSQYLYIGNSLAFSSGGSVGGGGAGGGSGDSSGTDGGTYSVEDYAYGTSPYTANLKTYSTGIYSVAYLISGTPVYSNGSTLHPTSMTSVAAYGFLNGYVPGTGGNGANGASAGTYGSGGAGGGGGGGAGGIGGIGSGALNIRFLDGALSINVPVNVQVQTYTPAQTGGAGGSGGAGAQGCVIIYY